MLESVKNFNYGVITVGDTPTVISRGSVFRNSLVLYNNGTAKIYLGNASVNTSSGFPIDAGGAVGFNHTADVYGIVESGTQEIRYFEEGA